MQQIKLNKEIHFYEYNNPMAVASYKDTEDLIASGVSCIHTMQMGLLNSYLFDFGYRIFVHETAEDYYEIKLGCDNERTNREIRITHNLFRMWTAGEFDKKDY